VTDLLKLPRVKFSSRKTLPHVSGIYFALSDGKLLYVGATKNLYQRWNIGGHHQHAALLQNGCTTLAWLAVEARVLPGLESRLIAELNPMLNRLRPTGEKLVDTHIYFPVKVLNQLRKLADRNRRSVSAEIVMAVEEKLTRDTKERDK
jgi:excinuclease UvrABC nuclease subunit